MPKGAVKFPLLLAVYGVAGSHKARSLSCAAFERQLRRAGATIMQGDAILLQREGQSIRLVGPDGPAFQEIPAGAGKVPPLWSSGGKSWQRGAADDPLLLSRPESMNSYRADGAKQVLAGLPHGGQLTAALLGGLIAAEQDLSPLNTSGVYQEGDAAMVAQDGKIAFCP